MKCPYGQLTSGTDVGERKRLARESRYPTHQVQLRAHTDSTPKHSINRVPQACAVRQPEWRFLLLAKVPVQSLEVLPPWLRRNTRCRVL